MDVIVGCGGRATGLYWMVGFKNDGGGGAGWGFT